MRHLYSALLYMLFPLLLLRMLWRSRRAPAYRQRLAQRFGLFATDFDVESPVIWVHTVSVGEVLAATPLIEQLLRDYPGHRMVLTTTTPTASTLVKSHFGGRVFHVYAPWDLPGSVRRFLGRTRPQLLILMETELWPNLIHACRRHGCRVILANGRMSERSARGYARLGQFTRSVLSQLDAVACQSAADGERFLALGLPATTLQNTGNVKFDLTLDEAQRARAIELHRELGVQGRPVVLAASTHRGEEQQILAAFARLRISAENCLLLLVPRHPERFDEVCDLCNAQGWAVVRRSGGVAPRPEDDILVGDTMGELALLFSAATVAFIGGSLVERGGHNALEAAVWGVPMVCGPHMFNFAEISRLLSEAGAMAWLQQPEQLGRCLQQLLADPRRRRQMGLAGVQVVASNRGAQQALLQLAAPYLSDASR